MVQLPQALVGRKTPTPLSGEKFSDGEVFFESDLVDAWLVLCFCL